MADARENGPFGWAAASRARPGETATGDLVVVRTVPGGTFVGALDGAGHGEPAARAAATARDELHDLAGPDLAAIVMRCHEVLRSTRGVAMMLAFLSATAGTLTWLGVGNVVGTLVSADGLGPRRQAWLATLGGVAGHALPPLVPGRLTLSHGDVLVLATDGVSAAFADALELSGLPQDIANRIVERHWTGTDDAVALVVRHLGAAT